MWTGALEIQGSKPIFTYSGSRASSAIWPRVARVRDDDHPDALAEAAARRLPAAGDDPLDGLAVDRLVGVAPHHLPVPENVGKLHGGMMTVTTLTDGGQDPVTVAQALHDFLAAAQSSLDLALYDFHLEPGLEELVVDTLIAARQAWRRGADRLQRRLPGADPGAAAADDDARGRRRLGLPVEADRRHPRPDAPQVRRPRPRHGLDGLDELDGRLVVTRGERDRHHRLPRSREGVHARLRAALGRRDRRGGRARRAAAVRTWTEIEIRPWFCPGYGDALSHRIAKAIGRAKRRVRICSPVITAAPVLATLAQVIADGKVDVAGAVDMPQVEDVQRQWGPNGVASLEAPALLDVIASGRFAGQALDAVGPGHRARLHAREDHRCRRRRLPRLVQPLPLRRDELRERAARSTTRPLRSAWPGTWTPFGLAIRSRASRLRSLHRVSRSVMTC